MQLQRVNNQPSLQASTLAPAAMAKARKLAGR